MAKEQKTAPPAGTGQVAGLGEAFSINLSSGQGTYVYRIPLPDGVAGHSPRLTLEYAHGVGHGPLGLGWRMGIRSISRRLDFGTPAEELVERFLDNGAEIVATTAIPMGPCANHVQPISALDAGWRIEERTGSFTSLASVLRRALRILIIRIGSSNGWWNAH